MATIKIPRKELTKHGLPDRGYDGVEVVEDNITDNSRWSIYHDLIFRWTDGKYYQTSYSVGATEMQDESPWGYEDEVECEEVAAVPVTVTQWQPVIERGHLVHDAGYPEDGAYFTAAEPDDMAAVIGKAVRTKSGWYALHEIKEAIS